MHRGSSTNIQKYKGSLEKRQLLHKNVKLQNSPYKHEKLSEILNFDSTTLETTRRLVWTLSTKPELDYEKPIDFEG